MLSRARALELAEGRLEYLWHGPGPAETPTLVFLHEGLGCTELWRDVPAALSRQTGFGALVYSRFGYGGSDPRPLPWPLRFMHIEALEVLPRLLAALGIEEHVLIGHSDGASIALIHAGGAPEPGLRGIVLESPHVFTEPSGLAAIAETRERFRAGDLRRRLERYHGANVDVAFNGWAEVWLDPGFVDWNIEACLPAIDLPMLVLQGTADPYGTLAHLEVIRAQAGGAVETITLESVGHAPHREAPEAYLQRVVAFAAKTLR